MPYCSFRPLVTPSRRWRADCATANRAVGQKQTLLPLIVHCRPVNKSGGFDKNVSFLRFRLKSVSGVLPCRQEGARKRPRAVHSKLPVLKDQLQNDLSELLAKNQAALPAGLPPEVVLFEPKSPEHGDFTLNHAMVHAKAAGVQPRDLAGRLVPIILSHPAVESADIAGPGFINLKIRPAALAGQLAAILAAGSKFGAVSKPHPRRIHVEYVSVNPNGPITIGSGRGAAFGDALVRVLRAGGDDVHSEYYINDALNSEQMRLFALSVKHYVDEANRTPSAFPEGGYRGDYVKEAAKGLASRLKADASIEEVRAEAQAEMITCQRRDLAMFRVEFSQWMSEQSLHDSGGVTRAIERLKAAGLADTDPWYDETIREKDASGKMHTETKRTEAEPGALWLRSNRLGDEKDRVLVRTDGRPAYIAGDLAYMDDKLGARAFDLSLLILGPDHHGYIGRMNAVAAALGFEPGRFQIIIYQLVRFLKDGALAPMRKRDGNIYELKDLVGEVGVDAARYFYVMRSHDTPLDFDIDLASRLGDDNPVFYVQYAHARICSVLAKAAEAGFAEVAWQEAYADLLNDPRELNLIQRIADLPEVVSRCAADFQVHRIPAYATELARAFHSFYDGCRVIQEDQPELSGARVCLVRCAQIGLAQSLSLIGVSAPTRMTREPVPAAQG